MTSLPTLLTGIRSCTLCAAHLPLGLTREDFFAPQLVAIVPMGYRFPGAGKSGDLPRRPECAPAWREPLLAVPRARVQNVLKA